MARALLPVAPPLLNPDRAENVQPSFQKGKTHVLFLYFGLKRGCPEGPGYGVVFFLGLLYEPDRILTIDGKITGA
jgi:hypothetical protein